MANPQHEEEESKSVVSIASTSLRKSRKSKRPSWFTPKRLLLIFCVINLVNYVDRGAISSNGVNGNLPICRNGKCKPATGIHVNPFKLIGVGLSIWTFAVTGCGFSFNFLSILICRMLVGVGEASLISLAAPLIDDNAPAAQKTLWLSTFYMCIPSGYALGYALRRLGFKHDESNEALTVQETAVSEVQGALNPKDRAVSMKEDVTNSTIHKPSKLCSIQLCNWFVLILGPKAGYNIYHMTNADMIFGGITIVCGILGTLAGGFLLDFMSNTMSNAFKDHIQNWRSTALILTSALIPAAAIWFTAIFMDSVDRYDEESDDEESDDEIGNN
ncbi:hypothetical protein J5N97_002048 [Dioscorea zingiberensis]|uniref:Major facilitator superfamily (MFS) profile domain-containing protein n=1 Tax=Dioscorea zingiberensis TaxID=325984 RepID=A0A9D5H1P7_9LILI|nr:hypothetical protein J5N97_002048 [Dioscorea zingiberensis]